MNRYIKRYHFGTAFGTKRCEVRLSFPLLVHLPALRSGCTHAGSSTIDIDTTDGDTPARIHTFSGPPIGEPVVLGGPFVMNTKVEITNAFGDFHAGKFGDIPRRSRLQYL